LQKPNEDDNQDDGQKQVDEPTAKRRDEKAEQPQKEQHEDDGFERVARHERLPVHGDVLGCGCRQDTLRIGRQLSSTSRAVADFLLPPAREVQL